MAVDRTTQDLAAAVQLHRAGKLDEAAKRYSQLRLRAPRHFDVWHLSGTLSLQQGRPIEAVTFLGQAHQLKPMDLVCLMRLGLAEMQMGQPRVAVTRLEKVVAAKPDFVEAWDNLGIARKVAGDLAGGIAAHQRAIETKPLHAPAWYNLGQALIMQGKPLDALAAHDRALQADPQHDKAHFGRGVALQALHRIPEAVAAYDAQLQREPHNTEAASSRLMALHYLDGISAAALAEQHRKFGASFPDPPASSVMPARTGDRLRIGFISPDFRHHAVASFFEPLLTHFDRTRCEIVLYHDHFVVDEVSNRLRAQPATTWRHIVGQPNAAVEKLIRADQLHALVDLAGHTGLNRLPVFARRVAPLQATYLGYPNTTGLSTMDLRFTDAWADPPGSEALNTEKLVRLDPCAWTWQPPANSPAVPPPPCLRNGYVTFGSFNNASKLSNGTLNRWARILAEVPSSRLLLKSGGLDQPAIADLLRARCAAAGLPPERLTLLGRVAATHDHLSAYGLIDIALDPHPYHGTTTTCEALWMGRPVVTLAGDRHSSRVGVSLLNAVGHSEWIAADDDTYLHIAVDLAARAAGHLQDVGRLLRDEVQERVQATGENLARQMITTFAAFRGRPDPIRHESPATTNAADT